MVIGKISSKELSSLLSKAKTEINREINYMTINVPELKEKVNTKDHFINTVLADKKVFLIGDENELKKIVGSE